MGKDCIFCKIASGEIPAEKILENDELVAFKDIHPAAPVHVLIVPKKHVPTLNDIEGENINLIGRMFMAAKDIAKELGVHESGYRSIINCNADSGQEVFHIHLHVMGGHRLGKMG